MHRHRTSVTIVAATLAALAFASFGPARPALATEPLNASSNPTELTNVGGTLFFAADDGLTGTELWKSDGTSLGTKRVKNINPGTASSFPARFKNLNGIAIFVATDGTHGFEIWRSNGTALGTTMIKDIRLGSADSGPQNLTRV